MRGIDFFFDCDALMHFKCLEINFKRGSLIYWFFGLVRKKKVKINPKNDDDRCFNIHQQLCFIIKKQKKPSKKSKILFLYK